MAHRRKEKTRPRADGAFVRVQREAQKGAIGTVWLARAETPDRIQLDTKLAATICKLPLTICMNREVSIVWDTPKMLLHHSSGSFGHPKGKGLPSTKIKSKTSPLRAYLCMMIVSREPINSLISSIGPAPCLLLRLGEIKQDAIYRLRLKA